jgi:hypothetical protein
MNFDDLNNKNGNNPFDNLPDELKAIAVERVTASLRDPKRRKGAIETAKRIGDDNMADVIGSMGNAYDIDKQIRNSLGYVKQMLDKFDENDDLFLPDRLVYRRNLYRNIVMFLGVSVQNLNDNLKEMFGGDPDAGTEQGSTGSP